MAIIIAQTIGFRYPMLHRDRNSQYALYLGPRDFPPQAAGVCSLRLVRQSDDTPRPFGRDRTAMRRLAPATICGLQVMVAPEFLYDMERALMPWSGLLTGAFGIAAISTFHRQAYLRSEILSYLAGAGLLAPVLWWTLTERRWIMVAFWVVFVVFGLVLAWFWYRHGAQWIDGIKTRLTLRSNLTRTGLTDVRYLDDVLPTARSHSDNTKYYKSDQFFMGIGEDQRPIYWTGRLPHLAVVGFSGSGKGRKLQDLAAQALLMGEAVIYLDPKDDEWAPHAMYEACRAANSRHFFLNLHPTAPPQFNLLEGLAAWECEELFIAGLNLTDKGRGSDFYAAKNRAAAREAAQRVANEKLTLAEVYSRLAKDPFWQEEAPGFLDRLGELARIRAINGKAGVGADGVTLQRVIDEGWGLYVVGSMTVPAVRRIQQMIFVRIQQIAMARDRIDRTPRTICVIADETRYHLSQPIVDGLAASRDKGMRVVLAFQSFTDLRDCPADMDPESVMNTVMANTPAKLIYKLDDPATAEWAAKKSGTILIESESTEIERNVALAEIMEGKRTVREGEDYLISTNVLQNMTTGWGVLFGDGLAKLCHVSPYLAKKRREAVTPKATEEPATAIPEVTGEAHRRGGDNFFALEE
jgi:hypothetical protein